MTTLVTTKICNSVKKQNKTKHGGLQGPSLNSFLMLSRRLYHRTDDKSRARLVPSNVMSLLSCYDEQSSLKQEDGVTVTTCAGFYLLTHHLKCARAHSFGCSLSSTWIMAVEKAHPLTVLVVPMSKRHPAFNTVAVLNHSLQVTWWSCTCCIITNCRGNFSNAFLV